MSRTAYYVKAFDEKIVKWMDKYHDNRITRGVMIFFTAVGSTGFAMTFSLLLLYIDMPMGMALASNLVISQIIIQSTKRIINRKRPYNTFKDLSPIRPPKCTYSLPSGHTGSAFSIALVMSDFIPEYAAIFFVIAGMVGLSRIYLVNHYPTDVIAGITVAALVYNLIPFH